jgi:hypothetical protein
MMVVGLLAAALPASSAPFGETPVSGLECVYVVGPVEPEITGQMMHIWGQVNENQFFSDDEGVLPSGTNTAVLDIVVNLKSGMAVWNSTCVFEPDVGEGTFEGIGGGWFKMDLETGEMLDSKGQGVFHGTGDYEGLTLKMDLYPGDIGECEGAPNLFDATIWDGFIVPPDL